MKTLVEAKQLSTVQEMINYLNRFSSKKPDLTAAATRDIQKKNVHFHKTKHDQDKQETEFYIAAAAAVAAAAEVLVYNNTNSHTGSEHSTM